MQQYNCMEIDLRHLYVIKTVKFIVRQKKLIHVRNPIDSVSKVRLEYFVRNEWHVFGVFNIKDSTDLTGEEGEGSEIKVVEYEVLIMCERVRAYCQEYEERIQMRMDVKVYLDAK